MRKQLLPVHSRLCVRPSLASTTPDLVTETGSPDSHTANMTDYVSVGKALKLVTPFKGDKKYVIAFIADVDTAFEIIDPRNEGTLFKFVESLVLLLLIGTWKTGVNLKSF